MPALLFVAVRRHLLKTPLRLPCVRMRCFWMLSSLVLALSVPRAAGAVAPEQAAVQKTLKMLVNAIRYNKDALALQQLGLAAMGQNLMGDAWSQMSEPQRKVFADNLGQLLQGMSFPRSREIFKYLDAIMYAPVTLTGGTAHCKSTAVIHRELKKKEMPIEWVLIKDGPVWKVVDTIFLGESTTQGIRDEQILPLLKEGGVPKVMEALETQAKRFPAAAK